MQRPAFRRRSRAPHLTDYERSLFLHRRLWSHLTVRMRLHLPSSTASRKSLESQSCAGVHMAATSAGRLELPGQARLADPSDPGHRDELRPLLLCAGVRQILDPTQLPIPASERASRPCALSVPRMPETTCTTFQSGVSPCFPSARRSPRPRRRSLAQSSAEWTRRRRPGPAPRPTAPSRPC
jgi:hypothetical protein